MMPLISKPTGVNTMTIDKLSRLTNQFTIEPSGCWQWRGYISKTGYGQFTVNRMAKRAHRVVWELVGNITNPKLVLDHLCDNKICVNPQHLRECTGWENSRRSPTNIGVVNTKKSHCVNGHELLGKNLTLKLRNRYDRDYYERVCVRCRAVANKKYKLKVALSHIEEQE